MVLNSNFNRINFILRNSILFEKPTASKQYPKAFGDLYSESYSVYSFIGIQAGIYRHLSLSWTWVPIGALSYPDKGTLAYILKV